MGFFYESFNATNVVILAIYTFAIIGMNEYARKSLRNGVISFVILPLFLLFFIWPNTAPGTGVMSWFYIAKTISIIGFALVILALRYNKKTTQVRWLVYLVPFFLGLNIFEAVMREFEVSSMAPGIYDNMFYMGGNWNIANAIAGFFNLILITGFTGIYISRDKTKTMVWPDMLPLWIIAYDLWNFTYMYNCIGLRSFYVLGILIACTYAEFAFRRGAWMQHRVFTLAFNQMILFTIPNAFANSSITVAPSYNPTAMWVLSLASLALNTYLLVYQARIIYKKKVNPYTQEVFTDHEFYKEIVEEDAKREGVEITQY